MKALSAEAYRSGSIMKLAVASAVLFETNCVMSPFLAASAKENGWVADSLLDVLFFEIERAPPEVLAATPAPA